jgi:uncharacterized protein HemX
MEETQKKTTKPKKTRTTAIKAVEAEPATSAKRNTTTIRSKVTTLRASHEEIARLAHRFWTERGGLHGSDTDDWLRAEQELLGKAS